MFRHQSWCEASNGVDSVLDIKRKQGTEKFKFNISKKIKAVKFPEFHAGKGLKDTVN